MISHDSLAEVAAKAYKSASWIAKGDVQGVCVERGKTLVVAPRGTELDMEDILRDMRAIPWYHWGLGMVGHRGFMKGAYNAWEELAELLMVPGRPIALTGHSLGAALATWIGLLMIYYGKPPSQIVGFGSPACVGPLGGKTLEAMGVEVVLYRCGNDIVPTTPILLQKWGVLEHVAPLTKIGTPSKKLGGPFFDHKMGRYLNKVPSTKRG